MMISVENFYWALFDNLLKPVGLDCWHYYPWGTKENLSRQQFKQPVCRRDFLDHVLFHFDQEPLWSEELGLYDLTPQAWSSKCAGILANSEQSALKTHICRSRGLIDWYFFYHGFAALDWYRDAQYIRHQYEIQDAFLSMNHVFDHRAYRAALLVRLLDKDIVCRGRISFHATQEDVVAELCNPYTRLSEPSRTLIRNNLHCLQDLPWRLDAVPVNGNLSARFGHEEYRLWQRSLWHVVNETVFYESKLHLTEKIFQPIVAQRPFVLVAAPGNLAYLRSYGFQTFDRWIDESYDMIQDPELRLDAIANEIARFALMSMQELKAIHQEMLAILEYNKQHFFGKFRRIIVDELVGNFDQCIRIWNNGRVDGRELPGHPDLESVKQILLS
jgi:hypothetical protein